MKKFVLLFSVLFFTICYGQVDYEFETFDPNYENLDGMLNRIMLFDGSEGFYDDDEAEIDLPFPFEFYGKTYNSLRVSTNGYLVFPDGQSGVSWNNTFLPDINGPNGIIAVFWDDLAVAQNQEVGKTDQISYVVQGQAPNRVLIIDYRSVQIRAPENQFTDDYIWAQAKLYEGSDVIELHYGDNEVNDGFTNATIGLEHPCGCLAVKGDHYYNNQFFAMGGYRYTPVPKYYTRNGVNMDYEVLNGLPGRVMLFDGNEGVYGNGEAEINLPFPFEFYGQEYNSLRVSTNGYLVFPEGEDGTNNINRIIPDIFAPAGIIAVFWDDLEVAQNAGIPDQISYIVQGQAPNRVLIVDYRSVTVNNSVDDYIWAQVKLYEGSHMIELHYHDSETDDGNVSATIGLEHPCDCIAEPGPNYNHNNDAVPEVAYRYVPYSDLIFMDGLDW